MSNDDLMTTAQAAKYLKIHPRTIRRHVIAGHVTPALDLNGRGYWFRRGDVDKLKETHGLETGRPAARRVRATVKDPIFEIGQQPVKADVEDASVNHDAYLYNG